MPRETMSTTRKQTNGECTPEEMAALARLKYVTDTTPGFLRRRAGRGFTYSRPGGHRLIKDAVLARIQSLAIPPAWTEVWICPFANGHLQATGQDEKHRKQYLYHERWREISNVVKFQKLIPFGQTLPFLRAKVRRHTKSRTLTREKVAALLVELLDNTAIRIGNEEYVRNNNSFGLSTLRKRHLSVKGSTIVFHFRAKGGQKHELSLKNLRLARMVAQCLESPGSQVFQYVSTAAGESEKYTSLTSTDVNAFIQQLTGQLFTAKDFRMWKATAIAAGHLYRHRDARTKTARIAVTKEAVCLSAGQLGNTSTVCRNYYIHPSILDSFVEGTFQNVSRQVRVKNAKWLSADEQALLKILARLQTDRRRTPRKMTAK